VKLSTGFQWNPIDFQWCFTYFPCFSTHNGLDKFSGFLIFSSKEICALLYYSCFLQNLSYFLTGFIMIIIVMGFNSIKSNASLTGRLPHKCPPPILLKCCGCCRGWCWRIFLRWKLLAEVYSLFVKKMALKMIFLYSQEIEHFTWKIKL